MRFNKPIGLHSEGFWGGNSNALACSARTAAWKPSVPLHVSRNSGARCTAEVTAKSQQPCQQVSTHWQLTPQHRLQQQSFHYHQPGSRPHTLLRIQQQSQPCRCSQPGTSAVPAGYDQPTCTVNSSSLPQQDRWHRRRGHLLYAITPCTPNHLDAQSASKRSSRVAVRSSSRDDRGVPEPPAAAGSAPSETTGSSSNQQQQQGKAAAGEQPQQQEARPTSTSTSTSDDIDAAVDAMLDKTWQELKRDLKKELPPEQAAMIDKWEVSDIQTDKVFREIAEQQLGPILELMGIREDPYAFFIDMFKLALMMQLLSAAVVFYGAELGLGLDAGDALRAVAGLTLGYFLRLSIKIEHLAGPLYNMFVQLLIQDNAVYEPTEAKPGERLATLNKLGLTIACAFFIPKLLFGWQNDDCWQIVVPMIGGLFFFDVCYIMALLIKLWGRDEE